MLVTAAAGFFNVFVQTGKVLLLEKKKFTLIATRIQKLRLVLVV